MIQIKDVWKDKRLTPDEKLLMLYVLTNADDAGTLKMKKATASSQTGLSVGTIESMLERFSTSYGLIRWSGEESTVTVGDAPIAETPKKKSAYDIPAVVDYLNQVCGTRFSAISRATQAHIRARYAEGFSLGDFKTVIDWKYKCWHDDEKMKSYLRPMTLFGTKFESYLMDAQAHAVKLDMNKPVEPEITDEEWLRM